MHTPGPWKVGSRHPGRVIADGGFIACCTRHPDDDDQPNEVEAANAHYIVRAVNSHASLLAACEAIVETDRKRAGITVNPHALYLEAVRLARAALALVKGE